MTDSPAPAGRAAASPDDMFVETVAALVAAHPAVARLDGGRFGDVATYLPGRRRLVGVRVGEPGEPVEIAVVVLGDRPIPQAVAEIRSAVAALRPGPVDVTVSDIAVGPLGDGP
ncbi:hypothetical protein [Pseudonocardia sp. N23]|uniref:hypothetical protein n=1 Tax=Pseudonocardia sp. N23 TaxID=1987376 RepID=UPI000C030B82|nr:hypothetical protein [Pseudonocardia sp. N23]GAY10541.1 hypothetical protein TOK_4902 [Pseudonocardia sp. N23]